MGPATSWGNRATYRATFRGFFLDGRVAAIDVNDVAEPLEGEKGNADGQSYLGNGDEEAQVIDGLGQEARVFEPGQQAKPRHAGKEHAQPGNAFRF